MPAANSVAETLKLLSGIFWFVNCLADDKNDNPVTIKGGGGAGSVAGRG